jgi:hypothetical protein
MAENRVHAADAAQSPAMPSDLWMTKRRIGVGGLMVLMIAIGAWVVEGIAQ